MTNSQSPDRGTLADELPTKSAMETALRYVRHQADELEKTATKVSGAGEGAEIYRDAAKCIAAALRSPSPYSGAAGLAAKIANSEASCFMLDAQQKQIVVAVLTAAANQSDGQGVRQEDTARFHGESLQQGPDTSSNPSTAATMSHGKGSGAASVAKPAAVSDRASHTATGPSDLSRAERTFSQCEKCWQPATCKKYGCRFPSPYSGAAGEVAGWQKRNANNDWSPVHDCSDESLYALDQAGWETRPLYAHPTLPRDAERETIERCAKIVDAEAERILSKQTPTTDPLSMTDTVNANLRMMACVLPEISAAIRALPSIPSREGPVQSTTEQADASRDHPVREATEAQIIAALEWSLEWMRQHNVDGLSPFKDYPPVKETIAGMYSAMISALPASPTSVMPDEGKQK